MTNLLITAQEVFKLSFTGEENMKTDRISDAVIRSAQERYLRPAFEGLYEKMLTGDYLDFVNEYIKPPLAYYVRYLVLPGISIQLSNMGAFVPENDYSKGATDRQRDTLRQSALMVADPLLEDAIRYVGSHISEFPEYRRKIKKQIFCKGGIILPYL